MASQSLYRKWRSQTFGDLVGQEQIVRTLKNALKSGNLFHAYLFTGPRGTGKTSAARLLAKAINCQNPQNGEPCNECQQCREITAGNSFNVIEIDAASNRGIDSIRELREKVMMPPATGKYKVYVLDEAHMLTTEAFNALLKTLEEPPDYAVFVMATTDVHKMLPTVLSRCQRFDFKRITTREIVAHLNFVAEQEHIKLAKSAAELIARSASGGMRDALSLLDQAIAYSGEMIELEQVQAMLGVADPRAIHKLIMQVAEIDSASGLHLIHELAEAGADLRQLNVQLIEYWRALMLAKAGADIAVILDKTTDEVQEIMQTARFFSQDELTEHARIFAQNDLIQKNQGTPQLGLELAFLASVELHRRTQHGQQINTAAISSSSSITAPSVSTASEQPRAVKPPQAQKATPPAKPEPVPQPVTLPQVYQEESVAEPDWDDLKFSDEPEVEEAKSVPEAVAQPVVSRPSLTLEQVQSRWENVKIRARQKNPITAGFLAVCTAIRVEGTADEAIIVMRVDQDIPYQFLQKKEHYGVVEWALSLEFGQKCRVQILGPGQMPPMVPPRNSRSRSSNTVAPLAPQNSARRERPTPPSTAPAPPVQPEREAPPEPEIQRQSSSSTEPTAEAETKPLARLNVVRENTSPTTPIDTLKQKASNDPIVLEVMRTFSARIVDIHPK